MWFINVIVIVCVVILKWLLLCVLFYVCMLRLCVVLCVVVGLVSVFNNVSEVGIDVDMLVVVIMLLFIM